MMPYINLKSVISVMLRAEHAEPTSELKRCIDWPEGKGFFRSLTIQLYKVCTGTRSIIVVSAKRRLPSTIWWRWPPLPNRQDYTDTSPSAGAVLPPTDKGEAK